MALGKIPFTLFVEKAIEPKKRFFRFDLNALADFEQEVGMGFSQLMSSKAIFAATRALLWAGLKWQDRSLTIQTAGDLIQKFVDAGGGIDEVLGAAMKAAMDQGAIGKATPVQDTDEDDEDEAGEGNAPTGPTLVPSPVAGPNGSSEPSTQPLEPSN